MKIVSFLFAFLSIQAVSFASTIDFAGYTWDVKDYCTYEVGPGPNYFCPENVSVDASGLHLGVQYNSSLSAYTCASVKTEVSPCGTFTFYLDGGFDDTDENLILGMFIYSDDSAENYHEIDVEAGRFGSIGGTNVKYKTWDPASPPSENYYVDLSQDTVHSIVWEPGGIRFNSYIGQSNLTTGGYVVGAYDGCDSTATMTARINLWMFSGENATQNHSVTISDFQYQPYIAALPPYSLSAVDSNGTAVIEWENDSYGSVVEVVERNLNSAGFTYLGDGVLGEYSDESLSPGDCAKYRVRVCHSGACSLYSDDDEVCIPSVDTDSETDTADTDTSGSMDVFVTDIYAGGSSGYVDGYITGYVPGPWHLRTWIWVDGDMVYNQGADLSVEDNESFHALKLWLSNPGPNKTIWITMHPYDDDQYGNNIHVSSTYIDPAEFETYFDSSVLMFGPYPTTGY